jgi:hypothetical protein
MRRWVWRVAAFVVFLCGVSAAGASYEYIAARRDLAAAPPPGRLIDVGGHRLHLWCEGQGTPVVVFESSAGGTALDWYRVQNDVAGFTTACALRPSRNGIQRCWTFPSDQRTHRRRIGGASAAKRHEGAGHPCWLVMGWSVCTCVRDETRDRCGGARAGGLIARGSGREIRRGRFRFGNLGVRVSVAPSPAPCGGTGHAATDSQSVCHSPRNRARANPGLRAGHHLSA